MRKSWYRCWIQSSFAAPHDSSVLWGGRLVSTFSGQVPKFRFWNAKPIDNWDRKTFYDK